MGEIKSTLDIIMEKTKNLTMTEEEKEDLRQKELAEKVKGWVLQYVDNRINQETLKSELKKEGQDNYSTLLKLLKKELMESLQMDDDNAKILELMKKLLNIQDAPYVKIIKDFHKEAALERSKRLENIKNLLTKSRVFGSAVIPNLTLDESWDTYYKELEATYKKRLQSFTDN